MATRSGIEYRAGNNNPGTSEDMPEWAKILVRNLDEYRRSQEESKAQIEFIMTQLLDLKAERSTEDTNQTIPKSPEPTNHRELEIRTEEPRWDAAKRGAKPEVYVFDGSLDPKKYMDWEVSLDEYFEWFQLPEGRRIQFPQMKLAGQARIYWRNLQATAERRREVAIATWTEMKGQLRGKYVPACYLPMIIDEWQHLQQGDGTVVEYIARFDDLMIRCNIDEEPVATLARFRAGLRAEYQRELVLHEVTTLEKAHRYTTNMEIYSAHVQRAGHAWSSSAQTQARPVGPDIPTALPVFPPNPLITGYPNPSASVPPPLPRPSLRLLLPPTTSDTPVPPANVGYRHQAGSPMNPPPLRAVPPTPPATERPTEGRNTGGARPRYISTLPTSANSRTACLSVRGGAISPLNAHLHGKLLGPHGRSSSRSRTRNMRLPMTPPRQQPKYTRRILTWRLVLKDTPEQSGALSRKSLR